MKAILVIPTFNHAATLPVVLAGARAALAAAGETLPVLVVDDGSTDGTAGVLAGEEGVEALSHAANRGKGAALMTAFVHAARNGYSHVVSMDADGQHDPADVGRLLEAARQHPHDLIIGHRDMEKCKEVPLRSRKGRDAARFWLRIQTGQQIPDSQCGLRVYPLMQVLAVPQRFDRYDYETEILARLAWGGVKVRSVPVRCIYFSGEARISHFRPWRDTLRGVRVNAFLLLRRLSPMRFKRLVATEDEHAFTFGAWWKWSTWKDAVKKSFRDASSNGELALSFAFGIFIGLTPFFFFQTILAIYFSRRLHLNVVAAVIGSQISIPPLAPFWFGLSIALGKLIVHGEWNFAELFSTSGAALSFTQGLWTFLLGNILVSVVVAMISLFAARVTLSCLRTEQVIHKV